MAKNKSTLLQKRKTAAASGQQSKPAKGLRFSSGKFAGLTIAKTLEVLAFESPSFRGHKEILFAGLCAWLLNPGDRKAMRDAIVIETVRIIARIERRERRNGKFSLLGFYLYAEPNRQLMSSVYFPTNGLTSVVAAHKRAPHTDDKRRKSAQEVKYVSAMVWTMDHNLRNQNSDQKITIKRAFTEVTNRKLVRSARKNNKKTSRYQFKERAARDYWKRHRRAAALLYAARCINISSDETLFDALIKNKITFKACAPHFKTWLAYAKYVTYDVLSKLPETHRKRALSETKIFSRIQNIDPSMPPIPPFKVDEATSS